MTTKLPNTNPCLPADQPLALKLTEGLGPLPPCARKVVYNESKGYSFDAYTADQMRSYALAEVQRAVAAMMSRCQWKRHDGCNYLGHCKPTD